METKFLDLKKIALDAVKESTCLNIKTDIHVENAVLPNLTNKRFKKQSYFLKSTQDSRPWEKFSNHLRRILQNVNIAKYD